MLKSCPAFVDVLSDVDLYKELAIPTVLSCCKGKILKNLALSLETKAGVSNFFKQQKTITFI